MPTAHKPITPRTDLILLDTGVLITYARRGEPAQRLEQIVALQSGKTEAVVSIISIAEALSFARKRGWSVRNQDALKELIQSRLVPIDINRPEILDAYVDIDHYSEKVCKPARSMGNQQNDLWIAATARVLNCTLVTMDKDFDHLHGTMIHRNFIAQERLKPSGPSDGKKS